ncbi:MAG: ABC transporter permease subunit [Nitrospirae bacterium]|nr:ABC transporter permease subunit [Nitrospirota bacterium]
MTSESQSAPGASPTAGVYGHTPPHSIAQPSHSLTWRRIFDRLAQAVITMGGIGVILSIIGIFVFLVKEVTPLFFAAQGDQTGQVAGAPPVETLPQSSLVGMDEHQELIYQLIGGSDRQIRFFDARSGTPLPYDLPSELAKIHITSIARAVGTGDRFAFGTDDGRLIPVMLEFTAGFGETRRIVPTITLGSPVQLTPATEHIIRLAYQPTERGTLTAALTDRGSLWYSASPFDHAPVALTSHGSEPVTALIFDSRGETLVVGTAGGNLYSYDVREGGQPSLAETLSVAPSGASVTALSYLIGDRSLVIGNSAGGVSVWMPVRQDQESAITRIRPIHHFDTHPASVTGISPSLRDKGFITGDAQGNLFVHYSTSAQTLLKLSGNDRAIRTLTFSPKADGAVALTDRGGLITYTIHNPHPETTIATLFTPVWYEGYERPEHVWQSSSGADDFEAKFGFLPLIYGTLKGTFYAMLVAVPLALLGAIYTAMFMHPDLRAKIKPTIEIMAALPTVILGFLAGLWLAPLLERIFPALIAMIVVVPASVAITATLWQYLPATIIRRLRPGMESFILIPVIIGIVWICLGFNQPIESFLFGTDYKTWFTTHWGLRYDQRNALVVGFAMGFAIVPIIFSISEEALSNVPRHLIAGSLALGATRWQTLVKLVLISASPGIFSAIMIGFGRAIGETMIVLMATGNTPIMDWSLFNGFRTLSANIAVEIPEAPYGGTLYRLLFLAAVLLFVFTFLINTVAELVRQRLRTKYSQY